MNRNVYAFLLFATAVFIAGCSGGSHPASMGSADSTGAADSAASPVDWDLALFARAGMSDPEYVDAREINDVSFVSNEDPDAFADLF
ncbi:MAG TPA: hypothetical protein VMU03_10695 [Gammaproteobacteria bacterium]|jgi:hypothetical protein|nr:hypothetical protein [Gammaproteobacteria bacterium]